MIGRFTTRANPRGHVQRPRNIVAITERSENVGTVGRRPLKEHPRVRGQLTYCPPTDD